MRMVAYVIGACFLDLLASKQSVNNDFMRGEKVSLTNAQIHVYKNSHGYVQANANVHEYTNICICT
jgi:hypothetical protein